MLTLGMVRLPYPGKEQDFLLPPKLFPQEEKEQQDFFLPPKLSPQEQEKEQQDFFLLPKLSPQEQEKEQEDSPLKSNNINNISFRINVA
ncbi:hypothetical protein GMJAKD_17375 [Candidatus Electrothrix aarhusensis]